jgi:hypothetical protein
VQLSLIAVFPSLRTGQRHSHTHTHTLTEGTGKLTCAVLQRLVHNVQKFSFLAFMSAKRFILYDIRTFRAVEFSIDNNATEFRSSFHVGDRKHFSMCLSSINCAHVQQLSAVALTRPSMVSVPLAMCSGARMFRNVTKFLWRICIFWKQCFDWLFRSH